jgi:uncharacterized C2H2 Zn-finger protein
MKDIESCPKCGFRFAKEYARVTACGDCKYSTLGDCGYIKCPNCGYEYKDKNYPEWLPRKKYSTV